jgi:hypothetical protein
MIATHADSFIAEAVVKGFSHTFNTSLALEAVLKDCEVAPIGDDKWEYADREEVSDDLGFRCSYYVWRLLTSCSRVMYRVLIMKFVLGWIQCTSRRDGLRMIYIASQHRGRWGTLVRPPLTGFKLFCPKLTHMVKQTTTTPPPSSSPPFPPLSKTPHYAASPPPSSHAPSPTVSSTTPQQGS